MSQTLQELKDKEYQEGYSYFMKNPSTSVSLEEYSKILSNYPAGPSRHFFSKGYNEARYLWIIEKFNIRGLIKAIEPIMIENKLFLKESYEGLDLYTMENEEQKLLIENFNFTTV